MHFEVRLLLQKLFNLGSLHKSAVIVRFERTSSELMRRHELYPFEVA